MFWVISVYSYFNIKNTLPKSGTFLLGHPVYVFVCVCVCVCVGRDSLVGIASRYVLNGPEIESRWRARFSAPVHNGPGVHPTSFTLDTGSLPGIKRPGRGVEHPTPSSAEVEERIELYIYSRSEPSWPFLG